MAQTKNFTIKRKDSERVVSDVLIEREELRIGSQQVDIDLILNHPTVSPVHAFIREINGTLWIVDTLDENATLLNGSCISAAPIQDGDEIQIGPFSLRVHFEGDAFQITVERGLKPTVKATANVARLEEEKALCILQERSGEPEKIAIGTPLYPAGIYGNAKARFNWTSTGDLKPPIRRELWLTWVVSTVALASVGALFFWNEVYSPGPLASAHSSSPRTIRGIARSTVSSCSDCHHLLGNKEHDCTNCHKVSPNSGGSTGFDPKISDAHQCANIGCGGCHVEHNGPDFPIKEVDNRLCMSCHNEQYEFRGKVLGAPHKGSAAKSNNDSPRKAGVGYIRDDTGVLTWKDQEGKTHTGQEALVRFHVEHPYTREEKCLYCHQGIRGKDEWQKSPRAACQACHAVSFDAGRIKAIGPNCATCHKQHGQYKDLKLAIARIPDSELRQFLGKVRSNGLYSLGDTTESFISSEVGGASVKRQGLGNWSWDFVSKLGLVPWHIWTGLVGVFALGGTMLVAFGNMRRRKLLQAECDRWRSPRDVQRDQEIEAVGNYRRPPPVLTFPRIDPDRCIGCHACIEACPHDVLTMSNAEIAMPISPNQCMDDAGCQEACPTQACIVANTGKKVAKSPRPDRNHETYMTNQPGLYVVGEVARVPLIKFAIVEGACVMDHIESELKQQPCDSAVEYDVVIIGAGPAGLSAALKATEKGIAHVVIEQHEALATIKSYPACKSINLTTDGREPPGLLPLPAGENSCRKEEILQFWTSVIASNKLRILEHEACAKIEPGDGFFTVTTVKGEGRETGIHTARKIVLAIGRSGTPNLTVEGVGSKIPVQRPATKCQKCDATRQPHQEVCSSCNVKFEESSTEFYLDDKVKYRLSNPGSYEGWQCAVVGGGNSAIEAAVALTGFVPTADEITFTLNNRVTLLVRGDFTPDLKFVNKMNLYDCWDAGRIDVRFRTEIKEIRQCEVILMNKKKEEIDRIPNDYVFYCIGTQWPEEFLMNSGITILNSRRNPAKHNAN